MGAVDPEKVRALLEEADGLAHGASRMALVDEAVRIADTFGDPALGYDARMAMLEAAVFGGYPEKALIAFSWLRATCERDPVRFPQSRAIAGFLVFEVDLLWAYKWVVQNTPGFAQISRAQIETSLNEMEEAYTRHQFSLRPVWMNRAWVAMELGEPREAVAQLYERWDASDRDAYADCDACEQNFRVEAYRYLGNWERELEAAQPLLCGELSCAEVPHLTISNLVMPMLAHGDLDEADRLHTRGYEMCHDNRDFLSELAEHVDYRIATGDIDGAATLAQRHLGWVAEARSGRRRWRWFVTLGELFDRLGPGATATLRLPAELVPPPDTDAATWFRAQADELATAFDRRNGNTFVSVSTAELRARIMA